MTCLSQQFQTRHHLEALVLHSDRHFDALPSEWLGARGVPGSERGSSPLGAKHRRDRRETKMTGREEQEKRRRGEEKDRSEVLSLFR